MAVQGEDIAVAVSSPLVSRADQSCLPFLLSAHSNSDAVAGCGLRLRALGLHQLLGHELCLGEQRLHQLPRGERRHYEIAAAGPPEVRVTTSLFLA